MKKTGAGRRSRRRNPLRIADPISLHLDVRMAPKYHPTPLSGGDRKALAKELGKARAMANILATQSAETRAKGEALIQQADRLLCESWNERMWSDGDPSQLHEPSAANQPPRPSSLTTIFEWDPVVTIWTDIASDLPFSRINDFSFSASARELATFLRSSSWPQKISIVAPFPTACRKSGKNAAACSFKNVE
jgi:hypothetical protein